MTRFLIEVPHEAQEAACARAIQTFHQTGSHFLANADWGCSDGEHKAWMILEMESKEDAQYVLPPSLRSEARIVRLNKYTMKDVEESRGHHEG